MTDKDDRDQERQVAERQIEDIGSDFNETYHEESKIQLTEKNNDAEECNLEVEVVITNGDAASDPREKNAQEKDDPEGGDRNLNEEKKNQLWTASMSMNRQNHSVSVLLVKTRPTEVEMLFWTDSCMFCAIE